MPSEVRTLAAPALPTVVRAADWLARMREDLRVELDAHGAVLIRGLPFHDPDGFAVLRDAVVSAPTPYREKATPRSDYGKGVVSSTDMPAGHHIRLHNENSYTLTFPGILLFGCLVAPAEGGATPVADCREVLRRLPDDLVHRVTGRGWALRRNYREDMSLSWQQAFGTTERAEVEAYCRDNEIGHEWRPDGLRTVQVRSATIRHPRLGHRAWFNHIAFWNTRTLESGIREVLLDECGPEGVPFETVYGDGVPFPAAEIDVMNEAYAAATRRESWRPGDVLVVDNLLAAHGREPFHGDRQILVAMGDPVALEGCSPAVPPAPAFAARPEAIDVR